MTPEEQFLLFASNHTEDYIKGWLDGMSECIETLKNISEKTQRGRCIYFGYKKATDGNQSHNKTFTGVFYHG